MRFAAALASGYVVVSLLYIAVSGHLAAELASSTEQLATIERWKGFAFVGVTGLLLLVLSLWILSRHERVVAGQVAANRALGTAQQKALAAEMAATVAHDFRNVLGVIQSAVELIEDSTSENELTELKNDMLAASRRGVELADKMIATARGTKTHQPTRCRLAGIIEQSLRLMHLSPRLRYCHIETRLDQKLEACVDEVVMDQMVSNLVLNAGDATSGKGRVLLVLREAEGETLIEVHDDGPGLGPKGSLGRFAAFQTTKADGWGLGLVSVRLAAEVHGGTLEPIPSELGGAAFRIHMPHRHLLGSAPTTTPVHPS